MGTRSPDSPDPAAPARGKKPVRRQVSCKVQVGRGPARAVRGGVAALTPEELRFHTGRTGRHGRDFFIHIRFEQITSLVADGPAGTLTVATAEGDEVVFFLGRLAVAWKEVIEERPDLLRDLGVSERSRVAVVAVDDDELLQLLEARVRGFGETADDAGDLDALLTGVEHRADLARLGALAARVRAGAGALWVIFRDGVRGVDEEEVAAAGRAAGLVPGKTVVLARDRVALRLARV
jgi:hypothetical protein